MLVNLAIVNKTQFDGITHRTFPAWNTAAASTNPLSVVTCPTTVNTCLVKLFVSDNPASAKLAFQCIGPGK